jgi:flagellar hook-associated protein 1 FlgK
MGLFTTLGIGVRSLLAEQGANEVTANNVANLNTPGYTRQRPLLTEGDPFVLGPLTLGSGVVFGQPQSVRDAVLELRLHDETQQQGRSDSSLVALQQVQTLFTESSGDLGTRLADLFARINDLSANPSSVTLRQALLTSASNLAGTFNNISRQLATQRRNLDLNVEQGVAQVNELSAKIAGVNQQITALENVHQNAAVLIDQRTVLLRDLSQLVDVRVIDTGTSIAVTTSTGTALVAGGQSFALAARIDPSGTDHIFAGTQDITAQLTAGSLAGQIAVRDQSIPGLLQNLDGLASALSTAFNAAQATGFDLNGQAGGNLFSVPPVGSGAAAAITVTLADPLDIAASSDGSPGSNGNLSAFAAIQKQALVSGQSPQDFYSGVVFQIGSATSQASAESEASGLILRQLSDQRAAESGVSLDEEAANLIRFQRAYEASARVVSTVNELLSTAVNLGKF